MRLCAYPPVLVLCSCLLLLLKLVNVEITLGMLALSRRYQGSSSAAWLASPGSPFRDRHHLTTCPELWERSAKRGHTCLAASRIGLFARPARAYSKAHRLPSAFRSSR